MEYDEFEPKYSAVAANIMFNRALQEGDHEEARKIAEMCIEIQEQE